jgi:dihydroorotate dehydrogenase electron transfer subunit
MIYQSKAKILSNIALSLGHYKIVLEAPEIAKVIWPGQFLEIKCSDTLDPFLRRPLSVHGIDAQRGVIEILFKVVGKGTEMLARKGRRDILDIIGPLGRGFFINESLNSYCLVAGGMGVAPLMALAEKLAQLKNKKLYLILGAKNKEFILLEDEFKQLGFQVEVATDNGSYGQKGLATELLKKFIPQRDLRRSRFNKKRELTSVTIGAYKPIDIIYACGPREMLKATARIAQENEIPTQVCLEEYMACGLGVCLGCAVKSKNGYTMVCKDGPVFEASEIIWE